MSGLPDDSAATFAMYSLSGACVHRVFLPLVSTSDSCDGEPPATPWAPLARAAGIVLDARTEWADVVGWGRGDGQTAPFRPAQGRAPRDTLGALRRLLLQVAPGQDHSCRLRPFEAVVGHGGVGASHVSIDLDGFFAAWRDAPMPGALSLGDQILLDAPRYADSVVLSAPEGLTDIGTDLGLEIVRAAPSCVLPDMTW